MSNKRKEMNAALQEHVVPVLRGMGFKGSLPHFRRQQPARIDLLTFQFDRHGGGFVVEVATCGVDGTEMHWGEQIPPNKVTAHDMYPPQRQRLTPVGAEDHWFRYDRWWGCRRATKELLSLLKSRAQDLWEETS